MKSVLTLLATGVVLAGSAGCGDDPDLSGTYQVTSHTYSADDCAVEGAAVADPAFIRFEKDEFFGVELFSLSGCASAADSECSEPTMLAMPFSDPVDNGYRGEVSYSSSSPPDCSLGYLLGTARLEGDGVRVEMRRFAETLALPEAACDTDEAKDRGDSMPCDGYEVIVATLVQ